MKEGVYLVEDPREPPSLTEIAFAKPEFYDREHDVTRTYMVGVRCWNTRGNFYCFLPLDVEDPGFSDDEAAGTVVVPTPQGPVTFRWPTAQDYADLAAFMSSDVVQFPEAATDEERQAFLATLIEIGQL